MTDDSVESTTAGRRQYQPLWTASAVAALLAFAVAALIPNPPTPPVLTWDKAQHSLVFLVLAFWCAQVWDRAPRRWLVTALLAYGFGIECLQGLTATRMFELMDFAADALGVVPGFWLAGACHGRVVDAMDAFLSRY